jgi:protein-tyrosine phosphatase
MTGTGAHGGPSEGGGAAPTRPVRLLFTCTANRVRSPLAAAISRRHLALLGVPAEVYSAGLLEEGLPAVEDMVEVARRFDVDLSPHRSARVNPERLEWADLVVTMTGQHVLDLIGVSPAIRDRTMTLREWAATTGRGRPITLWTPQEVRTWAAEATGRPIDALLSGDLDVADPIGRPRRFYRRAAEQIDQLLAVCFAPV